MNARQVSKTSSAPSSVGLVLVDREADLAEQRERGRERGPHGGLERQAAERRAPRHPAAAADRPRAAGASRRRRTAARAGRAHRGPAIAPQQQRDVADGARHRAVDRERQPRRRRGQRGTSPGVGRRPTTPFQAAGLRSEPPRSLPSAIGSIRQASAAAAPPLEPPAERVVSHGLRVAPKTGLNVCEPAPHSGVLVLPTMIAPAARSALDEQRVGGRHVVAEERRAVRRAHAGRVDQILVRDRQAVQRRQIARRAARGGRPRRAAASARSATSVTMALTRGLMRSMRARCARDELARRALDRRAARAAWSVAGSRQSSSPIRPNRTDAPVGAAQSRAGTP